MTKKLIKNVKTHLALLKTMENHKSHLSWLESYTKMSKLTSHELNIEKSQKSPHVTRKLHKNAKTHLMLLKTMKNHKVTKATQKYGS